MPTPAQVAENRFMTLDRLLLGDRIVFQHKDGECWPDAVWWDKPPQMGRPRLWLSTFNWLRRRALIIEGLRPKDSNYRDFDSVSVYCATPDAEDAFLDCCCAPFETKKAAASI